ncbi:MAG: hypothetical protein ACE5E6_01760 [Phycisphaerae bacterium]
MFKPRSTLALVAILGAMMTTSASADMLVLSAGDNLFSAPTLNQGWWSSGAVVNFDTNDNYFVGAHPGGGDVRDFFTFNLSSVPVGHQVVSATLNVVRAGEFGGSDNESEETLRFSGVATDAATLNFNDGMNAGIYADLGDGPVYGTFEIDGDGPATEVLSFGLNATALADINASLAGFFSIGGALISQDGDDSLFFASGGIPATLTIETQVIPTPGAALLCAIGLAIVVRVRSRMVPALARA